MVVEVSESTTGSFHVSGSLFVSGGMSEFRSGLTVNKHEGKAAFDDFIVYGGSVSGREQQGDPLLRVDASTNRIKIAMNTLSEGDATRLGIVTISGSLGIHATKNSQDAADVYFSKRRGHHRLQLYSLKMMSLVRSIITAMTAAKISLPQQFGPLSMELPETMTCLVVFS